MGVPARAQEGPPALWTHLLLLLLCQLLLDELLGPFHIQLHVCPQCTVLCRVCSPLLATTGRECPVLAPGAVGSFAGRGALCCWPLCPTAQGDQQLWLLHMTGAALP